MPAPAPTRCPHGHQGAHDGEKLHRHRHNATHASDRFLIRVPNPPR
ncbi:hypothetical protein [Micromonospora sp. WMMD1082]|nr:hypothetical protein [Micromonospora sp. WMMD1082]MDG4795035.1 hypothetical protein [Micromonospora sp. WMMD1082]